MITQDPEQYTKNPNILTEQEVLNSSVTRGVEFAIQTVNSRFGPEAEPDYRLAFHNINHTSDVIRRSELITKVIKEVSGDTLIDERQEKLVPLIAAWHDPVQEFDSVPEKFEDREILKRKRHTGANETASADELIDFMDKENLNNAEGNIYTDEDKQLARLSIDGTVPNWDPQLSTVVQPNRDKSGNVVTQVVPLADLGAAGIDGAEAAVKDGDLNFLEENIDAARLIADKANIDTYTKEWLKRRILATTEGQKTFIEGRKAKLDEDLQMFPAEVAQALKVKVFNKFDEAVATITEAAERRRQASADEVIGELAKALAT